MIVRLRLLCCFAVAVAVAVATDPPVPMWGGAAQYVTDVTLTAHDVVKSGASWGFTYSYLADFDANTTWARYDHRAGQRDEVCNSIKSGSDAPCTTTHASDGWMYVTVAGSCCKCSQNIGPVRSDWLRDGGTSYQGRSTVGGQQVDEWLKQGASDNHYYCTADQEQKPVRYMEHKNGMLKQWDFNLTSYHAGPIAKADMLFAPPPGCTSRCRASICLF